MKKRIYEDGDAPADVSVDTGDVADTADTADNTLDISDTSTETLSFGTTSKNIATYTVKLKDIIRRKKINEDEVKNDIINSVSISFYNNGRYNEEFSNCFDVQELKIDIINLYKRRLFNKKQLKITKDDSYITEMEYLINKHCKHNHKWRFEEFKQYGIQIIFGAKDTPCKVSVYQHF